jgi:hypothetical protein
MSDEHGGPAFPLSVSVFRNTNEEPVVYDSEDRNGGGMSLRDYFAAKAMQAALTSPQVLMLNGKRMDTGAAIAIWAYLQADAMIAERARTST